MEQLIRSLCAPDFVCAGPVQEKRQYRFNYPSVIAKMENPPIVIEKCLDISLYVCPEKIAFWKKVK